jgi:uncharacterized membrane protein/Mg-chelatase subunit ChlD
MIAFVEPLVLLGLLALPLLWALSLAARGGLPRYVRASARFWLSLLTRSAIIAALVLALAGVQLVLPAHDISVMFLLDTSDSVPLTERARAEDYVEQALSALPPDQQAGVVFFGEQAYLGRAPAFERTLPRLAGLPGGARTNIADAAQLALALLPAQGQRRLVLLSDGGQNAGDAQAAAALAGARGVPIDVVPLSTARAGTDVQITGMGLPPAAREGQRLALTLVVSSNITATGTLVVRADGNEVLRRELALLPGQRTLTEQLEPAPTGFNRFRAQIEVQGDVLPQNNAADGFTRVGGQPQVLLVEGVADAARNLHDALVAARFGVATISPSSAPTTIAGLSRYEAVALVDVPLHALPAATADLLPTYVRELGRGLAMIGGTRSFGAGGYAGTKIEDLLPVRVDPRPELQAPPVSLVIVIDISGSMSAWDAGVVKAKLAADGAAQIAAQLRPEDELTVIPFDSVARNPIGPLPGTQSDEIISRLRKMGPGARGITIFSALSDAARYLRASSSPLRHLITITDGDDTTEKEGGLELVNQLNAEGVSLTAISVGKGRDVAFIQDMAGAGGGRFFLVEDAHTLPGILDEDAKLVMRPYLVERPFTPIPTGSDGGVLRGIPPLPTLHGYIATTPRERSQVLLKAMQDDPLLATWQVGLGRTAAWTSDFQGKWGRELVQWPSFAQFAAQLVGWLLPPPGDQRISLAAHAAGGQLVLSAGLQGDDGQPRSNMRLAGRLIDAAGVTQPVLLQKIGPGSYRGLLPNTRPGTYQVQLTAEDEAGQPFATISGGAVVPASAEYRHVEGAGERLLSSLARVSGGRVDPPAAEIFAATSPSVGRAQEVWQPLLLLALLLLPLDIAVRRVRLSGMRSWAAESWGVLRLLGWQGLYRWVRGVRAKRVAAPIDLARLSDEELRRLHHELKEQARLRALAKGLGAKRMDKEGRPIDD